MYRQVKTTPRKRPRQNRSKATVDSILEATARVLIAEGFDGLTTNGVAEAAGVSIGSLYQYFPSKEALVAALAEEHAREGYALLLETIRDSAEQPRSIQELVRHYIGALVRLHANDPELHRVLMEQVPGIRSGVKAMQQVSNQSAALVRAWLEAHRAQFRPLDVEVATYVLVTAVEAVTHLRLVDRPAQLDTETLVAELSELVLGYLGLNESSRALVRPA